MKIHAAHSLKFAALAALALMLFNVCAQAAVNIYTNSAGGNWDAATGNWSLGAPTNGEDIVITNLPGKTVTVPSNAATNTLTVNSLTVGSRSGTANTLTLNNSATAPLHIVSNLLLQEGGALNVTSTNGLQVDGTTTIAAPGVFSSTLTNTTFTVTNLGFAKFYGDLIVGATNHSAALNLSGGTLQVLGQLRVADMPFSSGMVNMTGGNLILTNAGMILGDYGPGTFVQTGGTNTAQGVQLGNGGGSQATYSLSGGVLNCSQELLLGNNYGAGPCFFYVNTNGSLFVTNAAHTAYVDVALTGALILNGGLMQVDNLILTNGGHFTNLSGTLVFTKPFQVDNGGSVTVSGSGASISAPTMNFGSTGGGSANFIMESNATVNVISNFTSASDSLSHTSVWSVTSGATYIATNGTTAIGQFGSAELVVNCGTVIAKNIKLGGTGSSGKVLLHCGTIHTDGLQFNFILVDGGDLDGSGGTMIIGEDHDAAMEMDSGTSKAGAMYVGYSPGFTGTYTQNGGTVNVFTNVVVGDCISGALGNATLNGGTMYVTNATHTAVLDVRNGTFTLNAGATLVVDTLILTNSCGRFMNHGGVLVKNNPPILSAGLDADGDGMSNAAEAAAGTDPLNPASLFQVTGIVTTNGSNLRLDWTTVGGRSYVVQTNGNLGGGTFHDLSPVIPVPGTGESTTNYVHTNGAAAGSRFYRVRLGP
jgi:hypothetical protein